MPTKRRLKHMDRVSWHVDCRVVRGRVLLAAEELEQV